jgi:hypothetical protein
VAIQSFAHGERTTPIYILITWAPCGTKKRDWYRILAQKGRSTACRHNRLNSLETVELHPLQNSSHVLHVAHTQTQQTKKKLKQVLLSNQEKPKQIHIKYNYRTTGTAFLPGTQLTKIIFIVTSQTKFLTRSNVRIRRQHRQKRA